MAKGKGLGRPLSPSQEGKVVRERTNGINLYLPYIVQDAKNAKIECVVKDFWAPRLRQSLYRKLISIYFNKALLSVKDLDDMILDIEGNSIGLWHHKTLRKAYDLQVQFIPTPKQEKSTQAKVKKQKANTLESKSIPSEGKQETKQEVEASKPQS